MTNNKTVLAWIDEMKALVNPDKIVWIDGSEEQLEELRAISVSTGEMIKLNQDLLPGMSRDRALSQDHLLRINVVVDGVKRRKRGHPGLLQNDFRHSFTATPCKLLTNFHIVKVVL